MFFILSKDKILTYFISVFMIMLLLGIAFKTRNNNSRAVMSNKFEDNEYQLEKWWILFFIQDTIILVIFFFWRRHVFYRYYYW